VTDAHHLHRDREKDADSVGLIAEAEHRPKYPKPKVLLVDMPANSYDALRAAGFNVSEGSFGTPYAVAPSHEVLVYRPQAGRASGVEARRAVESQESAS
jgi:hypothetical protein